MTLKRLKEELDKIPNEVLNNDHEVVFQDGSYFFKVDGVVDYPDLKTIELYSFKNEAYDNNLKKIKED